MHARSICVTTSINARGPPELLPKERTLASPILEICSLGKSHLSPAGTDTAGNGRDAEEEDAGCGCLVAVWGVQCAANSISADGLLGRRNAILRHRECRYGTAELVPQIRWDHIVNL